MPTEEKTQRELDDEHDAKVASMKAEHQDMLDAKAAAIRSHLAKEKRAFNKRVAARRKKAKAAKAAQRRNRR